MSFYRGPNVVTNGLVLSLDAGNSKSYASGSTTWFDRSGNNYTGSLINGPTFNSDNGGSIVFDGIDDYIETTYTPGNITAQTISCWINKTNTQYSYVLAKSTLYYGFEIYPTTIYVNITQNQYGSVNYNINGWQNVVFTYNGSQVGNSGKLQIYLNGVNQNLSFTGTIPASVNVSDRMQIGRRYWATGFSQGSISQLTIYNRSLSASEILQNYNAVKSRFNLT